MEIKEKIVLASASPRRAQLLRQIGLEFEVDPSGADEEAAGSAEEVARLLAERKAVDVARRHPEALVIGADTIVCIEDRLLGKPQDAAQAKEMLRMLSGREHRVISGICCVLGEKIRSRAVVTSVCFDSLSEETINAYVAGGEPFDKAGGYGIQGQAGAFVREIHGCYFNVMGLPLNALTQLIKETIGKED